MFKGPYLLQQGIVVVRRWWISSSQPRYNQGTSNRGVQCAKETPMQTFWGLSLSRVLLSRDNAWRSSVCFGDYVPLRGALKIFSWDASLELWNTWPIPDNVQLKLLLLYGLGTKRLTLSQSKYEQGPITQSEQLPCACVTAFQGSVHV